MQPEEERRRVEDKKRKGEERGKGRREKEGMEREREEKRKQFPFSMQLGQSTVVSPYSQHIVFRLYVLLMSSKTFYFVSLIDY